MLPVRKVVSQSAIFTLFRPGAQRPVASIGDCAYLLNAAECPRRLAVVRRISISTMRMDSHHMGRNSPSHVFWFSLYFAMGTPSVLRIGPVKRK